jgi:hypothetical protein
MVVRFMHHRSLTTYSLAGTSRRPRHSYYTSAMLPSSVYRKVANMQVCIYVRTATPGWDLDSPRNTRVDSGIPASTTFDIKFV